MKDIALFNYVVSEESRRIDTYEQCTQLFFIVVLGKFKRHTMEKDTVHYNGLGFPLSSSSRYRKHI